MQKERCRFTISYNWLKTLNFKFFSASKILFHHSLTVLVHYQSLILFRFWGWYPNFRIIHDMYHFTFYLKYLKCVLQDCIIVYLCHLLWLVKILNTFHVIFKINLYRFCSPLLTISRLIFLSSYLDASVH